MNLLLNASNLRHGGGKTLALQLLNGIAPLRPDDKLYVLAPLTPEYAELVKHHNVTLLPLHKHYHRSWLTKLLQMHSAFPRWCDRLKIDKVISLGNAAFPAGGRPNLVYIQLPQLVYHESKAWKTMDMSAFMKNSLMDQYVAFHMRYATSYAVQTEVMRKRFIERFKLPEERIHIIPNAAMDAENMHPKPLPMPMQPLKLLFLSRYYSHKNFECLPAVAQLLKERDVPVEITLTISKDEAKGAAAVLNSVRGYPSIRNIGPVPLNEIGKVVDEHHGIFLPSLMESFSGVYAEALLHRRHIFTSHYDFATGLLGEAAFYFDPLRPEHIVSALELAANNPSKLSQKLRALELVAQQAPDITSVSRAFSRIIDTFV
jgi:glycosyltransferase involved in cell wall biosynthesis